VCRHLWLRGGVVLQVTLAAGADGHLGLVAPFAVVISPSCVGSAAVLEERRDHAAGCRDRGGGRAHKEAGPMAPARRRDRAALGTSGAGARLQCAEARVGAVVARDAGGAGSGASSRLLLGVTATAMPRALAETPNAE
jgi:hypothetical protein